MLKRKWVGYMRVEDGREVIVFWAGERMVLGRFIIDWSKVFVCDFFVFIIFGIFKVRFDSRGLGKGVFILVFFKYVYI